MSEVGGGGGDSAVKFQRVGYGNSVGGRNIIDAHSQQAGDFQHQRTIGGERIFLTEAGAKAYDQLAVAYEARVFPDMVENDSILPWADDRVPHPELADREQHHSGSTED